MVRGGDVSMMPWDSDLELALYSTGPNPVLSWCELDLQFKEQGDCIVRRLRQELGESVTWGTDFLAQWLHEEYLTVAKFRADVGGMLDINFEGHVPRMPIAVRMFGHTEVRVSWPIWEYLFFEVFRGSFEKKVGTSGNIASSVGQCGSDHTACIPDCQQDPSEGPCIFEFDDFFAHSRDPEGNLFSREAAGEECQDREEKRIMHSWRLLLLFVVSIVEAESWVMCSRVQS
ncbi:unnamed protein product [Polarella glacialis]|nr:unnamed protein product [Polarella glacialis]